MLQDQYRAIMQYSIPKELCQNSEKPPSHKASADWFCIKVSSRKIVYSYLIKMNCSAVAKISKEETIALSVTPLVWKARKAAAAAMKSAITPQKVGVSK